MIKKVLSLILTLALLGAVVFIAMRAGSDSRFVTDKDGGTGYDSADITLIEPVGNAVSFEIASYRDVAKVSTYQGIVSPDAIEYTYDSTLEFGGYAAFPGEAVSKGDLLFYAKDESVSDRIEDIEEENANLADEYASYLEGYVFDLERAKKDEYKSASAYQGLVSFRPEDEASTQYAMWAKGALPAEVAYKKAVMAREKLEQAYIEHTELYELESAYNEQRIKRLNEHMEDGLKRADRDGVVVAVETSDDPVTAGDVVMSVGFPEDKEIKCEFIAKSTVLSAQDVYALIDGVRYEVTYENMEPEEYRRLLKKNDAVYTTFKVEDPENSVKLGQAACIVVVEKLKKNVLCIPKDAISRDESGAFVYLLSDSDSSIYTQVKVGESDNYFAEITYGLSEGDRVLYDPPYDMGTKFGKVTSGGIKTEFKADGYLFYPSSEYLTPDVRQGTVYLKEICVDRFEQVTEGQVVARIEVVSDTIEAERISRKINRQNERIIDLNKKKQETYNEDDLKLLDRSIKERTRSIEHLKKSLDKITAKSGVIDIKAPYDGIITDISQSKDGELISGDTKLVQISSNDSSYIAVEDNGFLSYGNDVTVTYKDNSGKRADIDGTVVMLNPYALSKELMSRYSFIRVSAEDIKELNPLGSDLQNGYWNRVRFSVSATVKDVNNVLLIPKTAAFKSNTDTYVITRGDDGRPYLIKFYAGGSDNANYWVAYGDITEGMEICLE